MVLRHCRRHSVIAKSLAHVLLCLGALAGATGACSSKSGGGNGGGQQNADCANSPNGSVCTASQTCGCTSDADCAGSSAASPKCDTTAGACG